MDTTKDVLLSLELDSAAIWHLERQMESYCQQARSLNLYVCLSPCAPVFLDNIPDMRS